MAERLVEVDAVQIRRIFPWVHLFRAFRIAVDIRKVFLAALALVALTAGNAAFSNLPFAPPAAKKEAQWPWSVQPGTVKSQNIPEEFVNNPSGTLVRVFSDWRTPLAPLHTVVDPARTLFRPQQTWSEIAFAWTKLLWALCVWALFAGAITRMAAVQFAGDGKIGMWGALKFSAENFLSYLSAPLLPAVGIAAIWLVCLVGGLVGLIPFAGPVIVGFFYWLAIGLGLLMALIVMGIAAGWPLMYAAISTEGSDGYDGFSRAYGYVYSRPWHYLWFTVVSLAYGSAVIVFVSFAATLAVFLAARAVSTGMGIGGVQALISANPSLFGGSSILGKSTNLDPSFWGTTPAGIWLEVTALLVTSFVSSYFWSATTIIYFLLRASDDATSLKEVYLPEEEDEDDLLPLVGVAESSHPVVERPAEGEFAAAVPKSDGTEDTEFDIRTGPQKGTAKD
ncbi:MAG: hypothetical protein AB7O26_15800 [Planctomycetaceae bacterium]